MTARAQLLGIVRRNRSLPVLAGAVVLSLSLALAYTLQRREDTRFRWALLRNQNRK